MSRRTRFARGWSAAIAATFLAALFHLLSGGSAPETSLLLLSLALSGLVCTALAGRVLSLWRLSLAVVLSQSVFHALFSLGPAPTPAGAASPMAGHAGHGVTVATVPGTMVMDCAPPLMWAGHALAALATIAVLRHGEVTAVRLLAVLRLHVVSFLPVVLPLSIEPGGLVVRADRPIRPLRNLGAPLLVMRHRGPPLLSFMP